jgi:subtilisin family serine protease
VYSLKVLDGAGLGSLSSALDAVKWAAGAEGKAAGIGVINLSLASRIDPSDVNYASTREAVCGVLREASDAGLLVVVAAGNYGEDLRAYLPAACGAPAVLTVTSVDSATGAASSFSNWLPAGAPSELAAALIAAPGGSILSTMTRSKDTDGYRQLSGTSMAAPHVAGVGAACILNGACQRSSTGAAKAAVLKAAARERSMRGDGYGSGAGDTASTGRSYGPLVWAGKF